MKWTLHWQQSLHESFTLDAARTVAGRSAAALASQLPPNAMTMDAAELRGYVRARAASMVRRELVSLGLVDVVPFTIELIDRTVHLVMRQQLVELQSSRIRRLAA